MYTQRQASQIRQQFWTTFGQYMAPLPNADGDKINWVNYKTGNRFIQVKMEAGHQLASFTIAIHHPDSHVQQLYFQQFVMQQKIFESIAGKDWLWHPPQTGEHGKAFGNISKEITGSNIFDKSNWPELIRFFKKSIITFDEFWLLARHGFEAL